MVPSLGCLGTWPSRLDWAGAGSPEPEGLGLNPTPPCILWRLGRVPGSSCLSFPLCKVGTRTEGVMKTERVSRAPRRLPDMQTPEWRPSWEVAGSRGGQLPPAAVSGCPIPSQARGQELWPFKDGEVEAQSCRTCPTKVSVSTGAETKPRRGRLSSRHLSLTVPEAQVQGQGVDCAAGESSLPTLQTCAFPLRPLVVERGSALFREGTNPARQVPTLTTSLTLNPRPEGSASKRSPTGGWPCGGGVHVA